jgi:hypothetical protein
MDAQELRDDDTKRMDFIESNPQMYFNVHKAGKQGMRWRFGHFSNYPQDYFQTARDAIDAAMRVI